jgi:hypothetical protein
LEKKTKQLSVATVETGLEVNAEKTVQQFMSCERKQENTTTQGQAIIPYIAWQTSDTQEQFRVCKSVHHHTFN